MLPMFLGIGPTKTATTWLFACLREHPHIFLPAAKETQFFARRKYSDDRAEYEAFFAGARDAQIPGEISPRYFAHPEAAHRIHKHMPDVKLVVTLRHPVQRLESDYWHMRRMTVDVKAREQFNLPDTLEQALQSHEDALVGPSLYATHLRRWQELFDTQQMHIIFNEDIKTSPNAVVKDLFDFLGVDVSFTPETLTAQGTSVRAGVSPRSPLLGRVHTTMYTVLVRGIYRPLRRTIGMKHAAAIKEAIGIRQMMSAVFHRKGYPRMSDETRHMLLQRFDAEVRELEQMTGRDLSHWRE